MNSMSVDTLSVVVERDLPYPPEKIWRALTQPHLIEEWLMKGDFQPEMGHRFSLRADWGSVNCEVRAIEPGKALSYTWDPRTSGASSPGPYSRARREHGCAWSRQVSNRSSSHITGALTPAGRGSWTPWSAFSENGTDAVSSTAFERGDVAATQEED